MSYYNNRIEAKDLLGKTIKKIRKGHDSLEIILSDGSKYKMYHEQDCCESVSIEDIEGNLRDLLGSPLTQAEESTSSKYQPGQKKDDYDDSFTWTFYKFATVKGYVTIRWFGSSNGYYSESVNIVKL